MKELERHIEHLLLNNDCVVLPDFGGFVAHAEDARLDKRDGTFLPPTRTLGFNPQLKLNDSLLAESYAEAYDLSYPEALRRVESDIEALRKELKNSGSYSFHGLGTLRLNDEGHCVFTPCEAGILTPELYALGGIKTGKASRQDEEPTLHIKVRHVKYAAAACLAALAIMMFPSQQSGPTDKLALNEASMRTGLFENQTAREAAEQPSSVEQAAVNWENLKLDTSVNQPIYTVQLACQITPEAAKAFVEKLHAMGFDMAELYIAGQEGRVIYGKYTSEAQAWHVQSVLSRAKTLADCWVTRIK